MHERAVITNAKFIYMGKGKHLLNKLRYFPVP